MSPTYGSRYPASDLIRSAVEAAVPGSVLELIEHRSETTLIVAAERIRDVCRFLRDDQDWRFLLLADIAGADWPQREKRFDVVYNLDSPDRNLRVRLKVQTAEGEPVPSVTDVWSTANWQEREVYDMFGVVFTDHPDLRRILMPEDWEGHPLRKDFPLSYELPQFTHNLSERPEWLERGLRWFGNRQYGSGEPQVSFPRQGPEGKPVAGWEGRPPEEKESEPKRREGGETD
jgi:NADH-quinone oxidoreductase subunit C